MGIDETWIRDDEFRLETVKKHEGTLVRNMWVRVIQTDLREKIHSEGGSTTDYSPRLNKNSEKVSRGLEFSSLHSLIHLRCEQAASASMGEAGPTTVPSPCGRLYPLNHESK